MTTITMDGGIMIAQGARVGDEPPAAKFLCIMPVSHASQRITMEPMATTVRRDSRTGRKKLTGKDTRNRQTNRENARPAR